VGAALYGVTDEFHQRFVAGRTSDPFDLAFDILGGLLGGALYLIVTHYVARFRSKGKIEGNRPAVSSL
jgi:VanZ family protein